jgi:hypothetical protein
MSGMDAQEPRPAQGRGPLLEPRQRTALPVRLRRPTETRSAQLTLQSQNRDFGEAAIVGGTGSDADAAKFDKHWLAPYC